jgi:hypothetical protein
MKIKTLVSLLVVCLFALAVYAADNPNMGTWKLNEAKSKIPAGAGKNTTVAYSDAGNGMIKVTTDGVDGSGKPAHSEWTGKFDGKPYPVTGVDGASRTYTRKGDRGLEFNQTQGGKTVLSGKIEVAKDGKTRSVDVDGTSTDGKKYKAKTLYDKQ